MKAILADRLYIPKKDVEQDHLDEVLTHHLYDEAKCRRCDNLPERFNAICALCRYYKGSRELYTVTPLDGESGKFVGLPIGGAPKFLKQMGISQSALRVEDLRSVVRAKNPLKFTGKLYEGEVVNGAKTANQVDIVARTLSGLKEKKRGFCIVSPRAGKTVIATSIVCRTKLRTLFIAADSTLLDQFMDTLNQVTDFKTKPAAAGIAFAPKDFTKFSHVTCTTWQSLMDQHGTDRMDAIWDRFGLVIVDEVHLESSPEFFRVVNGINAKYFLGLTATLRRKDGSEVSSIATFGSILVEEEVPALIPTVYAIQTKILSKRKGYVHLITDLGRNRRRNAIIANLVFEILRQDPRRRVLVVCKRTSHILAFTSILNGMASHSDEVADGRWPSDLAIAYHGKLSKTSGPRTPIAKRAAAMQAIKKGKHPVTVAQDTLVKYGVNVPLWTDLILAMPLSSKISPDPEYHQLTLRPCTPAPNKPKPAIYHLVDVNGMAEGCFISCISKSASVLNYDLDASVVSLMRGTNTKGISAARTLSKKPW